MSEQPEDNIEGIMVHFEQGTIENCAKVCERRGCDDCAAEIRKVFEQEDSGDQPEQ